MMQPLEYKSDGSRKRWRRARWGILALAIMLGCVFAVPKSARSKLWLLYRQRQCMNEQTKQDCIASEEDPVNGPRMLAAAGYLPYANNKPLPAVRRSAAWEEYAKSVHLRPFGCIFMHGLVSPAGHERLVVVYLLNDTSPLSVVIVPGTITRSPEVVHRKGGRDGSA